MMREVEDSLCAGGGLKGCEGGLERLGLGGTVWLGESGRSLGDIAPLVNRLMEEGESSVDKNKYRKFNVLFNIK